MYISVLATAPAMQKQGLGSAMLHHIMRCADGQGLHTYLEASSVSNQRFYKRHGFEDIVMHKPAVDVPATYVMARLATRSTKPQSPVASFRT